MMAMDFEPPFQETCKTLLQSTTHEQEAFDDHHDNDSVIEECELPLIDLRRLNFGGQEERNECVNEMVRAAKQWGFFQLVNHGIPGQVLERMQCEQKRLFHQPFATKVDKGFLNLSANSYRWGNPGATYLRQFSWSEAFHISIADIPRMKEHNNLRSTTEAFVKLVSGLARSLAELLAQPLGVDSVYFKDNCPPDASYIRLNRYAPCPSSSQVSGLISHTDTDFLTILFQDQVGGLELFKDGTWLSVKPNPQTLIVNVGDLFEALSNGVYKSIKHRVVMKQEVERFSVAYFYCPSYDVVIRCHGEPAAYREFTLREYQQQTLIDVQKTGDKIGLSRFLL